MEQIRVLLVDDHRHVHQAVTLALNKSDDIILVGAAANGVEAVQLCEQLQPDLILMDVLMPVMDGIEATRQIKERFPVIKVLVLSAFQDDDSVRAMLAEGASGYVLKHSLANDLAQTIRTTHMGTTVLASEVTHVLLEQPQREDVPDFGLTDREIEVLKLLTTAKTNPQIADALVISRSTVKFHISNILEKLHVETRAEAIALALRNKLV